MWEQKVKVRVSTVKIHLQAAVSHDLSLLCFATDVFTDEFWGRLDGVCNALDNMEARIYVDIQVRHKCSSQI